MIEKYAANARFCLLANYVDKITVALQSRLTRYRFGPLEKEQVRWRLEYIASKERCVSLPFPGVVHDPASPRPSPSLDRGHDVTMMCVCSVVTEPEGLDAIIKCAAGDMRKAVHILQVSTIVTLVHQR